MRKKISNLLKRFKIRDAKTDEYIVEFMDRDFFLTR